jgi:UDP-hydrolysing UDP-N-acetyl-D-glucosamine 2-epimerase
MAVAVAWLRESLCQTCSSVPRTVAIFTGNRAEYGFAYPVISAIATDPRLEYRLMVGGAHLDEDFGNTAAEIERDGFRVDHEVDLSMSNDGLSGTVEAIGTGVLSVAAILDKARPDLMLVSADRFESFAAVIASTQLGVPTAHIEGGDLTEGGALDDSVRHAITKLAHLHFTTNQDATDRVLRMGEEPWRVHTVGLPMLDLVARGRFMPPAEVGELLSIDPARPLVAFTQHSVTTEPDLAVAQIQPSLRALTRLAERGIQIVITYPNNDAGGRRIVEELQRFADRRIPNIVVRPNLGRGLYHGLLAVCGRTGRGVCAGNSSSGIKETPAFGCPAVNIGSRQRGRLRAGNVIDVGYDTDAIEAAIRRGIDDDVWRADCASVDNPYGKGDSGQRMADILATVELDQRLIQKRHLL